MKYMTLTILLYKKYLQRNKLRSWKKTTRERKKKKPNENLFNLFWTTFAYFPIYCGHKYSSMWPFRNKYLSSKIY